MKGALIFIGDELISGKILNKNAELAGKILFALGLEISEIVTIPDQEEIIINTFLRLIKDCDFIITSGGLGPTDDDLTVSALAKALNLELWEEENILSALLSSPEYKTSLEIAKKMSRIPKDAQILDEKYKMSGFYLNFQRKFLFFLPGVPQQFSYLLKEKIVPILCAQENLCKEERKLKNFIFFDINETDLNQFIQTLNPEEEIKIGYYPISPEVHLVLYGKEEKLKELSQKIKEKFKINLVSEEGEGLEIVIGKFLRERNLTLATAESCTGGKLASLITKISGSSFYFERGFVTYSIESKKEILGIKKETLREKGVYSFETALEMAYLAKIKAKTDFALSTTGIAGPTGGTPELPVGTIFIGLSTPKKVYAIHFLFEGDRETIQNLASYTALDILRRYLLYGEGFFSYRFAKGIKEGTF